MKWLIKRFTEPSTYAGLSALILGIGQLGDINEAPAVADVLTDAGAIAVTQSPILGIAALIAGLVAMFSGEKGDAK